jgi:ketosteroid isomerase-like protein
MAMKNFLVGATLLWMVALASAYQHTTSDEGGRILALEKVWNQALEEKDVKALDMLLANSLVSVDLDGSVQNKSEFLASVKAPDFRPSQVVTEQTNVQVYGDAAVVIGIFRIKGTDKGKAFSHRERFVDTWVESNGAWQCVATTSNLIATRPAGEPATQP